MSAHPIRTAFEHAGDEPSPEFRDALRARFLGEVVQSATTTGTPDLEETIVTITEETPRLGRSRPRVVLGIAAAIVVIAGLTVVVINHRSQPSAIDTSRDPAIAKDALISVDELGPRWQVSQGMLASRTAADIAATVTECAPYMDYAFDNAGRKAITTGASFDGPGWSMLQYVYLFPTEGAASKAMKKIAESGFVLCFNKFIEAVIPAVTPGWKGTTTTVTAPPMLQHGDRQVVLGQLDAYRSGTLTTSRTVMNVFVQVGRGIVYVNPITDEHNSLDPAGSIEKAVSVATSDLTAALAGKPKG